MTLRTRLVLTLAVLVTAGLLVIGGLVVGFTRGNLVQQVDDQLLAAAGERPFRAPGGAFGRGDDLTGRQFAYVLVNRQGEVIESIACGPPGNPKPLPTVPEPTAALARAGVVETAAVDGSLRYRLIVQPTIGNTFLALAAPLDGVDTSIRSLVRNLVVVGAGVLLAMLGLAWLLVRRDLRPLETIARTADTIAAGDLSHRSDLPHDGSEVGRLGTAFDRMLDQIQASFQEQDRALDAKARSEARLRQFVADASHELRTPLTTLRGYADLYRAGGLSEPEALERAMSRIGTESRRMGGLVEDLLLLARLDQGRPLRREPVDLSQLVADAVADARAIEPARPVTDRVTTGIRVTGDEDRLRQVVGNLLANIRVHTPAETAVDVSLTAEAGRARLTVTDHGPGIDQAVAERVFDRFFRADPGRSRDRGGSGLGLSIAASVVQAHGGEVRHEPTSGGGATFVVEVPVEARATVRSGLDERRRPADGTVGLEPQDRPGEPGVTFGLDGQREGRA